MSFYKNLYLKLNLIHKNFISKKSYFSFSGVDLIIENIFRNQKKGFYVDVGCQHPIKNNNTYLLFKKGWFGLNIDLDKDNIDLFNAARPNDENVNIAISNKIGETDLYFYHKKSPINTISKTTSNFQKANVSEVKRIKTETLTNILSKSITKNQKINLLSVDVEGHELQVFEGLDFNTFGPDVIIVEYLDLNVRKLEIKNLSIDNIINSDVYKFLILKKYILVNCIYSDLIFIKKDFRD
tara:strand:- start:1000 stop:1716 length:717 start_codon:yes stop_codon:yes gene_type:complete